MPTHHLIIGNGAAGMSAAEEIRRRSPHSAITILSDEPCPMYSRPGLAYLLTGEISEPTIFCRTAEDYARQRSPLIHGRAVALDPTRRSVRLDDGRILGFDTLLLATGATPVPAPFPGIDLDGVVYLDTLESTQDLLRRVAARPQVAVVVGGGITAMEMAEGLRLRGLTVHYFIRKKTIWSALLNDAEGKIVERCALARGINLHYDTEIAEVVGRGGRVKGVRTTGGDQLECEIVGAAVGVRPNIALTKGTPIQTDRGILVDEGQQSSVPGVFAAGDVAQVYDQWSGERRVDDLWSSAVAAGRVAGANMAGARMSYVKGAPFNAARVFGAHVTSIGQAGADRRKGNDDPNQTLQYQSRGSSEVWWARPGGPYGSAWSHDGENSLRIVLRDQLIVGALILGNQDLADPLHDLIAQRVDISPIRNQLRTDEPALGDIVRRFWQDWQHMPREGAA